MAESSKIAEAIQSLYLANDYERQQAALPAHLKPILKHAIPRLDQSNSATFISSDIWFGDAHTRLAAAVQQCFHPDVQQRRIVSVVQAYGSGKTKTGLRLSDSFILLPIRFNVDLTHFSSLTDALLDEQRRLLSELGNSPTQLQMLDFSERCFRLVQLFFLTLVALYDHCIANNIIDLSAKARFTLALLLLIDNQHIVAWCRAFFLQHQHKVQDEDAFQTLADELMKPRALKVVFLLDEIHVLFGKARGFCLHHIDRPSAEHTIAAWRAEQIHCTPSSGHAYCTDLFYQFRVGMLRNLLNPTNAFGFVTCSTVFCTWNIIEQDNTALARGIVDQFFHLHSFTYSEIVSAVQTLFEVNKSLLDESEIPSYKKLSTYSRPIFLMEFLTSLCETFCSLPDSSDVTIQRWLCDTLQTTEESMIQRARSQLNLLVTNDMADMWTSRQIIHMLYTTHRLCGGTLALSNDASDEQTLARLVSKGVARLDLEPGRFRIGDECFVEALLQCYTARQDQDDAVLKSLAQNTNLSRGLTSHDESEKNFLVPRVLAWLALTGQLTMGVLHADSDDFVMEIIASKAKCAGTLLELGLGTHPADEPSLLVKIVQGAQYILLPTASAGPDLWLRAPIHDKECVIAVQSKVESSVYSMPTFRAALNSLDPFSMYSSTRAARARSAWLPYLQLMKTMPYHRIIFSACGFDSQVHFAVREYNLARGRGAPGQPSRYIHLLHLNDIRKCIGPVYDVIVDQLRMPVRPSESDSTIVFCRQWRDLSLSQRKNMKLAELQQLCQDRGITTTNARKAQLVNALNEAEDRVAALVSSLDPRFE